MNNSYPQGAITSISGKAVVLSGNNIDTDRIIPARFLKCVSFDGLGAQVFADDRKEAGEHPFDHPENQGANILFVNRNFGCGSSREHAPQALMRWGIRAVVAESFAEIFYGNCLALGIPCLIANQTTALQLQEEANQNPKPIFNLDIKTASVSAAGKSWNLELAGGSQQMLLSGRWDGTAQLIANNEALNKTASALPYLNNFQ
ncbi:3-isopropylmalate dehydratase small subunit [Synechococcus lacustris C3-12m-Tous]|uniref:3-isopropylmalate dehydratase small subunit n=1 Tax=Synechococcus lacustris TaxID=2116544 RepID=UPI0020CF15B7|nr:3-isopropylmalate dehydratase small subunit [Synechococcus lacustris]MCP9925485.1 3-isopropylmalate dehydratase small subunit [Synechococcus lacustris C3-12m-Tous]